MSAAQSQLRASPLTLRASDIARVHTALAFLAFGSALVLGCLFHYKKIVKNGVAGYPHEWFPSVSATIGDWYPERSVFQLFIAVNSGPRFALGALQYFVQRSSTSILPVVVFVTGIVRTLSCGGWVYITSTDDHDAHDVLMIGYILCNIPWMLGGIACTPKEHTRQRRKRTTIASLFFGSIIPMIYFFVQHKVHRIPGAYTHYSFFEWGLIILDVLYDSVTELTFAEAGLEISIGASGDIDLQNKGASGIDSKSPDSRTTESNSQIVEQQNSGEKNKPVSEHGAPSRALISNAIVSAIGKHRDAMSFAVDLYLAFTFWTIFTALIPTLFYFSVWELGIAGAELALLSILSPALLGVKPIRAWASTRIGRVTLHVLSLVGLAAYKLPTPAQRLLIVTFASFVSCIGAVVDWSDPSSVSSQSISFDLGLFLSSLSKHANHSNNPLWPMVDERTGGYNKIGILLALLSILEFALRADDKSDAARKAEEAARVNARSQASLTTWLPSSLALGSLLFSLHCFLTDPSTLIAWSWSGYPIEGPVPHLHGSVTHLAQAVGALLPTLGPAAAAILTNPIWFSFGAVSAYTFFSFKDWIGYYGGLGLAVFLMSIVPQTLQKAASTPFVGRTYFTAFFVAVLFYLANVWTVAYAFVPAGFLLRERTDLVLLAQLVLLVPAFSWKRSKSSDNPSLRLPPRSGLYPFIALSLMAITSGLVTLYRTPIKAYQPYRTGPRIVRAGIWTVHFGMDNEGRDSQRAMRDLIRDLELDVVGLLETDLHRPVYGNRDLTRVMAEEIGFHVDVGPGPNQHTWGAVLLSKFPIINSTHHLLPSPHGELAPAISAFLDVYGTEVLVVVSHNGQEEDPLDRELQATELARIMNLTYPTPVIFLGYVVSKPHAPRPAPYRILVEDGRVHDIDSDDLDRWCEYILYRGLYRTSYLRMSRGKVTDTELQAGQFVVPRFGETVVDDSAVARYLRIHKETLGNSHWFPMEYYGNRHSGGKNGHYYHVFGTPLYYNLPEGALL